MSQLALACLHPCCRQRPCKSTMYVAACCCSSVSVLGSVLGCHLGVQLYTSAGCGHVVCSAAHALSNTERAFDFVCCSQKVVVAHTQVCCPETCQHGSNSAAQQRCKDGVFAAACQQQVKSKTSTCVGCAVSTPVCSCAAGIPHQGLKARMSTPVKLHGEVGLV